MIWREPYPGYLVSESGKCKRIEHTIIRVDGISMRFRERFMIGTMDKAGYLYYTFGGKSTLAHRVVAKLFIPNPHNYPCVNHIDGNKLNNSVSNLEWCTISQNHQHAYDVLGRKGYWTGKKGADNKRSKPVAKIDKDGNIISCFVSAQEASINAGCLKGAVAKSIREGYRIKGFFYKLL